jgi:hypothetical protein
VCRTKRAQSLVRLFLATEGVNPAHKDSKGGTTLWWEVVHGYEDVVTELLAMKMVDPDSPGPDRQKARTGRRPCYMPQNTGKRP